MSNQPSRFVPGRLIAWAAVGLVASLVLIMACGGAFLLWRGRGEPEVTPATSTPVAARPSPTPSKTPTREKTRTPATTATPRATARPGSTPPAGAPTPIVCDDPEALSKLTVAPGQQFTCTLREDDLNDELSQLPDVPCKPLTVAMTDGQVYLTCSLGLRMTAIAEVVAEDCRMQIAIVGGTFGFTDAVQDLLKENEDIFPYDKICVEEATVGDGELVISGYGR